MKLISTINTLKSNSIDVLNKISNFLCRINTEDYNEVTNKIYSKIERIRNDYNNQLQNNYNTLLEKKIYAEFRIEYYKTQQWLRDNKGEHIDRNYCNHHNNTIKENNQSQRINKASTHSNIPKLNMNKIKESLSRNKITKEDRIDNNNKNNNSVYTKLMYEKKKHSKGKDNDSNAKWLDNQSCDSGSKESATKQRPLSHRNKLPLKQSNQESFLHYTENHLSKLPPCSDQFSQIIQIKTEIMLIQEDIKKIKGKNAVKASINRPVNEDFVSHITKQNNKMWNEMSIMRTEMNELFNTVKTLNNKISNVLEDNKSLKQENDQLKDHIYKLKQEKHNMICSNSNNHANKINSRNCNSTSYLFRHNSKTNLNQNYNNDSDTILKAQRLNYQYDSSSCNSISDLQNNYMKNDNSKDE